MSSQGYRQPLKMVAVGIAIALVGAMLSAIDNSLATTLGVVLILAGMAYAIAIAVLRLNIR